MTKEEKLEEAKRLYKTANADQKYVLERLFPELKESEDERIRKEMIFYFQEEIPQCSIQEHADKMKVFIAWLEKQGEQPKKNDVCDNCDQQGSCVSPCPMKLVEKQGEQKSTNEPKFKVDEWIYHEISGNVFHINRIENHIYISDEGATISFGRQNDWRLWTIQDAKDGDVLVCLKYAGDIIPNIFIFKDIKIKDNDVFCYCSFLDTFRIESYVANADPINTDFYPATKEQCDLLFQKMKEAGYEWDAEKKELKKIEQKSAEWSAYDKATLEYIIEDIKELRDSETDESSIEAYERELNLLQAINESTKLSNYTNPAEWSEEDERIRSVIWNSLDMECLTAHGVTYEKVLDWFDSLKDKVQPQPQSKQEWREEDEEMIEGLTNCLDELEKEHGWNYVYVNGKDIKLNKVREWLKPQNWTKEDKERYISCLQKLSMGNPEQPETINSKWFKEHVYPQNRWKPSNEQMEALKSSAYCRDKKMSKILFELYQDLKKLKE